jgi:uncharacterized protein (TIGR02271 family)
MIDDHTTLNITGGMDVFGADGEKVGSVSGVEGDYVVVSKGFFFPTDYYIPTSAITTADAESVYLNVTKDDALNQGWDVVPETTTAAYGGDQTTVAQGDLGVGTPVETRQAETYSTSGGTTPFAHDADTGHIEETDRIDLALTEEELTATKREVERGAVQVDKVVTEEQQTLDVPVTEERVNVSRRVVDREVAPGETTFEEGTIEVPVRGEEVAVEKRARVREEIEIGKERVAGTEQVTDTVRREEARITDGTGTVIDDAEDRNRPRR